MEREKQKKGEREIKKKKKTRMTKRENDENTRRKFMRKIKIVQMCGQE